MVPNPPIPSMQEASSAPGKFSPCVQVPTLYLGDLPDFFFALEIRFLRSHGRSLSLLHEPAVANNE